MILHRANIYRLYPTDEQAQRLTEWVGSCRFMYNVALEQRRDWWRPGRRFNFATQCREVTAVREEVDWIKDVPVHALQQAMRDLDRAFVNFWEGRAEYPKPRRKFENDSMRFPDPSAFGFRRISKHWGEVKLPKLGWVKLRWDKAIPGTVKNITVSLKTGIWTVAAQYETEIADPQPSELPPVGIDRGVAVFAAMSDGTKVEPGNFGKKARKKLCKAQRNLSRKKKGSNNWKKQKARVGKIQGKIARQRKDYLHKLSTDIAKSHGVVAMENLKVRNMTASAAGTVEEPGKNVRQKAGLNRSILDQGWGMFRTMLNYKLAERGGRLVEVNPAFTSQTCSECGVVDARSRASQARFVCVACGHEENADVNAAKNILSRAGCSVLPVEGQRGRRPDEAGTIRRAA
ncbi:RNA-guided endonuclease TnpB family protein [Methylosinus sp. PW1]|uniref:RNA-guided endonuclease InsQ/TnpB family protein n=1 Tax=Methylosinus sp. PW1 TaxID=107636 RepID=UPI00068A975A|nr:RNA-guided endonuclease TnpB family protein [Methylosinus sp. PW1]